MGAWNGRKGYDDEQAFLASDALNRSADSVVLDGQNYATRVRQAGLDQGLSIADSDAMFKSTLALNPTSKKDNKQLNVFAKSAIAQTGKKYNNASLPTQINHHRKLSY